jgi:hypothetical protein
VTILPGQASYTASTRNGVTSLACDRRTASFKVERIYGFVRKQAAVPSVPPAAQLSYGRDFPCPDPLVLRAITEGAGRHRPF